MWSFPSYTHVEYIINEETNYFSEGVNYSIEAAFVNRGDVFSHSHKIWQNVT